MKFFKHFIIYLSILSIITVAIFATSPLKSYAEVPASQKAVAHSASWGSYDFSYVFHEKYWTIEDPTGIPTSTLASPYYFYTDDNETFFKVDGYDLLQLVLTRGVGIVYKPERATAFIQAFLAAITTPDTINSVFVQGGVYDGQHNFIGYALNDISGCYYEGIPVPSDTPAITIPSDLNNDVYNYYNYYTTQNNLGCDYFTFYPPSATYVKEHYVTSTNSYFNKATFESWLDTQIENSDNLLYLSYFPTFDNTSDVTYLFNSYYTPPTSAQRIYGGIRLSDCYYINESYENGTNYTYWNNFCDYYNLNKDNTELLFTDIVDYELPSVDKYFYFNTYDKSTNTKKTSGFYEQVLNVWYGNYETSNNWTLSHVEFGYHNSGKGYSFPIGKTLTIYKNLDVYNSINVNKDYEPDNYKSSIYYNYNSQDDNSFTVNYTYIDNSETNNETIYNEGTDVFYEQVDQGEQSIDTPPIEITIIIENIIPEPSEDPEDPDDPDDPTDPDDPNLEDDTVLDAILKALKRFFDVIGKLLGTVLAGLLEMIDAILESIAGIMENLTGLTEFISALFSWIPSPVPEVLAIGFSLCILAAIIKFIRG